MKPIRNSAKAVIIDERNRILLTQNRDRDGLFYLFPGGGQEIGEKLEEAVIRECMEEIGCRVIVNDIWYIREYIGKNHEHAEWDYDVHQVEFYFECRLDGELAMEAATNPDSDQVGVEWIELERLDRIRVYPQRLVKPLQQGLRERRYMGDTN
ncbi:NUDIX domain-containing protein [Paenibacillus thiaminolyticus]|uniref:NUDIX domain-containing protein n=1 Tax=Paenibacillus thiaminolyticus TaxID=49283 RepID=A0AAP9DRB5_PANTH|nr:NUDIX domain-containing protein [Paenibacillus thiaminolyticus]MCY9535961.1 NUDIX domain-containing protein [Paenibacillus thiaminolyticus]MCY9602378.1 NUDIX domain-containing protein [Paenibacillus thiaminolyticus]MCY9608773.1 NUDIX domain-containing protein [Paenibacillus thiaminolyticus]MCY9613520.1 NUDIX domain-containing protein [Paenibacillus thiaminolyticus]MCY9620338.1 NUDIX domain-containing protein [Paenibacillus thiaminolyticus]